MLFLARPSGNTRAELSCEFASNFEAGLFELSWLAVRARRLHQETASEPASARMGPLVARGPSSGAPDKSLTH